jgi:hypothetical protein
MTVITYGLSLSTHADWADEKPELIACVQSNDEEWGLALAGYAERLRGDHAFNNGSILMGPSPLAADSEMGGFLLGEQHVIAAEASLIELPARKVRLRGAFPIYECETPLITEIGATEFFARSAGIDFRDIQRAHIWQ